MWKRNLFLLAILFLTLLLEISFFSTINWQGKIALVLLFLFSCFLFLPFNFNFLLLLIGGCILDLYSFLPFGLITLSLFFTLIIIYFLDKYFNNKSYFFLIFFLFLSIFFYNFFIFILSYFMKYLNFTEFTYFFNIFNISWQILINVSILTFIYFFRNLLKKYLLFYEK